MDTLTGKTQKQQFNLAREAQARQAAQLAEQEANLKAVEAGQRAIRGGGSGLLAYIDKKTTGSGLSQLLGGGGAA